MEAVDTEVFPARAGMDRSLSPQALSSAAFSPRVRGWTEHRAGVVLHELRFPRACGDGPATIADGGEISFDVFPARAGMDRTILSRV